MKKKTWKEFQECKLLWWVNRSLHIFGWAIIIAFDDTTGEFVEAYPARVSFRGFDEDVEEQGFIGLTKHVSDNITKLIGDVEP